jgi:hypothetical protein
MIIWIFIFITCTFVPIPHTITEPGYFFTTQSYTHTSHETWQAYKMATLIQIYSLDNVKTSVSNLGVAYKLYELLGSPLVDATMWITELKLQTERFKFVMNKYRHTYRKILGNNRSKWKTKYHHNLAPTTYWTLLIYITHPHVVQTLQQKKSKQTIASRVQQPVQTLMGWDMQSNTVHYITFSLENGIPSFK